MPKWLVIYHLDTTFGIENKNQNDSGANVISIGFFLPAGWGESHHQPKIYSYPPPRKSPHPHQIFIPPHHHHQKLISSLNNDFQVITQ